MTYTLIGTGNMAWFLATRLQQAGMVCKGVWGRNREAADELAAILQCGVADDLSSVTDAGDCCILAVADHAVKEVAATLHLPGTVLIHTAGSVSLDIILQEEKAVLWPVYSITRNDLPEHRHVPLMVEAGSEHSLGVVKELAGILSDQVYEVNETQRKWLHLTAVIGNNFTNHLMAVCEQICREQGLSFDILMPILLQTFQRIQHASPVEVQTGPAKRGDMSTMQMHLELLKNHPLWQQVYTGISASIADMYSPKK